MNVRPSTISIVAIFLMLATFGVNVAQADTSWVRPPVNPVLVASGTGWDSGEVFGPRVYYDGSTYHMWYTGTIRLWGYRIGYAASNDGVSWIKSSANPVLLPGPPGSWDSGFVSSPSVIYNGSVYMMWYVGGKQPSEYHYYTYSGSQGFGLATSTDGVAWTKYGNGSPVMTTSALDASVMFDPWVLQIGNQFKMWYTCGSGIESRLEVCYASSPDGIHWTKNPTEIFKGTGSEYDWDSDDVFSPNVLYDGHTYGMWYSGDHYTNQTIAIAQIGYATSLDGITWTRAAGNPILSPSAYGSWDSGDVDETGVVQVGGTFMLYYSAIANPNTNGPYRIGLAESPAGFAVPELASPVLMAGITLLLSAAVLVVRRRGPP